MSLYASGDGTIREIDDALYAAWVAAGNPKAAAWTLAPPRPSDNAEWTGSGWVIPEPSPAPQAVDASQLRGWLSVAMGLSQEQIDRVLASADPLQEPARHEVR